MANRLAVREALTRSRSLFEESDHEEGEHVARQALASAIACADPELQGQAWDLISQHAYRFGKLTVAASAAEQRLALLPDDAIDRLRAELHCRLALIFDALQLDAASLRHATAAVELARTCDDLPLLCQSLSRLGAARATLGDWRPAASVVEQALAFARAEDDAEEIFRALNNLSSLLSEAAEQALRRDDREAADEAVRIGLVYAADAVDSARRSGDPFRKAIAHVNHSGLLVEAGRYDEAIAGCDAADAIARQHRYAELSVHLIHVRAKAFARRGDLRTAILLLDTTLATIEHDNLPLMIRMRESLHAFNKQAGNVEAALMHIEELLKLERQRAARRADAELHLLLERAEVQRTRLAAESAQRDAEMQRIRALQLQGERDVLEARANEMGRHALEDPLTGLPNRRRVETVLQDVLHHAGGRHGSLCVAVIDIDHFKAINDGFGHGVGDDVLRAIGAILSHGLRDTDLVGRVGGEEFMLILERTPIDVAADACERVRRAIESFDWSGIQPRLTVTASIGVCAVDEPCASRTVIGQADSALYAAKAAGRNRVVVDRRPCAGA